MLFKISTDSFSFGQLQRHRAMLSDESLVW